MKKNKSSYKYRNKKSLRCMASKDGLVDLVNVEKTDVLMKNLIASKEQSFSLDKIILQLNDKIIKLTHEKKQLEEIIKEHQTIHKEYSQERLSLVAKEQQAARRILSYERSMSFRLGYAIIFGFKSFDGFKNLIKTILQLLRERGSRKKASNTVNITRELLRQPNSNGKDVKWKSQKPTYKWQTQINPPLRSFLEKISLADGEREVKVEKNTPIKRSISCDGYKQIILKINAYTKDDIKQEKAVILTIIFWGANKQRLQSIVDLPFSSVLNKNYFYLNTYQDQSDEILLLLPDACIEVEVAVELWDAKTDIYVDAQLYVDKLSDGISVIIPTYNGEKTIIECLESLVFQTLDYALFDVIVVINGPADNTKKLLINYKNKHPNFRLTYFILEEANVGKARNFAIEKSTRNWITFIDDDDFIHENYLLTFYRNAIYHSLVLTGLEDVQDGVVKHSVIQSQLDKAIKKDAIEYADVTSTLTMNACKLAPAHMVRSTLYDPCLKSGEDVVYWCELILKFNPKIILASDYSESNYKRVINNNSVSRQRESYDFNVSQRLDVIIRLNNLILRSDNLRITEFIQSKVVAQSGFIKKYLKNHLEDYLRFAADVENLKLNNKIIAEINSIFSDTLIISYCFSPFIDTSGVVMSKRIRAMEKPVDIIFNNMDKVRPVDERLLEITNKFLGKRIKLNAPQAFSNWVAIERFSDLALVEMGDLVRNRPVYRSIYSRAMWPASHFAAAVIKKKHPQIRWIAEFSDPLLMDVSGAIRFEGIERNWLEKHGFLEDAKETYVNDNLFYWAEMLPYQFADELIFTNENQLKYMLSYTDSLLHKMIHNKAVILPQPTLERKFYNISPVTLDLDNNSINFAYFGSFYVNRGFSSFVNAWVKLEEKYRNKLKLYVYTQQAAEVVLGSMPKELSQLVYIQPYIGYFDFLKSTDQFDGLIVMDAETRGLKFNNPYLPSKLSDYLGSQAKTLALVEEGSTMDRMSHPKLIKNKLEDINGLIGILMDWATIKVK